MQDCLAPMTGRLHSAETKLKMSKVRLGEKHPLFGKKVSEEVRKKMSDAVKGKNHWNYGNYGKTTSEEVQRKIIKAKGTAVNVFDLKTNENFIYDSGNQAAAAIPCTRSVFQNYLKSGKILMGRYILSKNNNDSSKDK